ncbi:PLP-dependent aminotransferase family protein [Mycolicibacter terrae]|uniref:PLP-dependent aminotransferase family protein n=1 Tax=Mycolicibacter terrae TaxID=1788 RepID=A0ACD2EQ71_9MYCO|nr:PLP-dependent aminotransferase family protein [Mycolicibacter terrae]RRR46661.1 PLP-dependent aminotransferase family protein [Mycolicibacter terrae]
MDLHLELPPGHGRRAALENALRQAIRDGRLAAGERLPSSRALAGQLGLARGTVVEAYSQLVAEGYLRSRQGAVTEVARSPGMPPTPATVPAPTRVVADFRLGRPDLSLFPRAEWLRALRRALHVTPHAELGPLDPRGALRLRTALAGYLGRARGVLTTPERIVICSGFTQGLRLVCDALAVAGATSIAVENPCLPDHRATLAAAGLDSIPLDVDQHGARPDADAAPAAAVLLTPAHQAPMGVTLAADRRSEFVRLATAAGTYLIEDDYDGEFRYDRHPVGALQGLAPEQVVYAGSASKSLAPGLRLGWLALPADLVDAVVEAKRRADRGTDVLAQLALAELIESGALDRHIRRMRRRYRQRRDALVHTLGRAVPAIPLQGIAAGLHAVLVLPEGQSEADVLAAARQRQIALTGLAPFWHGPPKAEGIVLGYGTPAEHEYRRALAHLGQLLGGLASLDEGEAKLEPPRKFGGLASLDGGEAKLEPPKNPRHSR